MHSTIKSLLVETTHEGCRTPNQNKERQQQEIAGGGCDSHDRERLTRILFGLVLDLNQLIDSQTDRDGARNNTKVTTHSDRHREDAADHRRDRHALLRTLLIRRWRRRLPTTLHLLRLLK